MRITYLILVLILLIGVSGSWSQRQLWTNGTANTIGHKDIQIAALSPSIYGISESMDISSHVFACIFAPNVSLKKNWLKKSRLSIASGHGIYYPTPLAKQIASRNYFPSLTDSTIIPDVIAVRSELLISYGWGETDCPAFTGEEFNPENTFRGHTQLVTLKLGIQSGFNRGIFPLVNEPLLFQRSYYYNNNLCYYAGFDIDGHMTTFIDYAIDLDYYNFSEGVYALEHKGMIKWFMGKKFFHLMLGYHVSYADTPTGSEFLFGPMLDFVWIMHRNKMELGLFGKKMF